MKEPFLSDEAFLHDVVVWQVDATYHFHLWWLGQSGFLVQWRRQHLLLDPYLSDSLTRKYAGTDKPHVRVTRRVVDPARLDSVVVATSSHNHTDHLDAETLVALSRPNPGLALVHPMANEAFIRDRLGADAPGLIGLVDGQSARATPFEFIGVPAAHNRLDVDAAGRHLYMGFIVRVGRWNLYHSGDTLLYDGLVERLRPHNIDLALLPINGDRPERRVAGNLNGREAAWLAKEIGARLVIPCHYDMFEFNTADPDDEFVPECKRLGQPYRVLRQGERFSSSDLPPRGG